MAGGSRPPVDSVRRLRSPPRAGSVAFEVECITVKDKQRGYIEGKAGACPKSGKLAIQGNFFFTDANTNVDATSKTDGTITCKR